MIYMNASCAVFFKYRRINKLFMHKTLKIFYRIAFSFVAGFHSVGLLLLPTFDQNYLVPKRVTYSETGRTVLIKTGHVSQIGHELIPQGIFRINFFISTIFYASL